MSEENPFAGLSRSFLAMMFSGYEHHEKSGHGFHADDKKWECHECIAAGVWIDPAVKP